MTKYVLPDLDYDYGALEPHIIGSILELHHDVHHAAYVKNANEAAARLEEVTATEDDTPLAALERSLAFNLSGHILHSIFWKNLTPEGGGEPDDELGQAIKRAFGSFDHFRGRMVAVASGIMGSGWAALTWERLSERPMITQIYDHQSNLNQGGVPLMVIDAWEHACYLQYQNQKVAFFEPVWHLWNWKDIAARFTSARRLDLALVPRH